MDGSDARRGFCMEGRFDLKEMMLNGRKFRVKGKLCMRGKYGLFQLFLLR